MSRVVIVLPSVHDIMAVEQPLLEQGLWFDLIPKPVVLSTDCGMVIECRDDSLREILAIIRGKGSTIVGVFMLEPGEAPQSIDVDRELMI